MYNGYSVSELSVLEGVGSKRQKILESIGIQTFRDLVYYLPYRYLDKSHFRNALELKENEYAHVCGTVIDVSTVGGLKKRLIVRLQIPEGEINIVYFNGVSFLERRFRVDVRLQAWGMVQYFGGWQITHPDIKILKSNENPKGEIVPLYHLTQMMSDAKMEHRFLKKIIEQTIHRFSFTDPFEPNLRQILGLWEEKELLKKTHLPTTLKEALSTYQQHQIRELYPLCYRLEKSRLKRKQQGQSFLLQKNVVSQVINQLPFELTEGQQEALAYIEQQFMKPYQFVGLLQGDVGSGKTIVAILAGLHIISHNFQVVLLAPTEILAEQHFKTLQFFLKDMGINITLLTGSIHDSSEVIQQIKEGRTHWIVGTHAVYSEKVSYSSLGFVIIDEQHRFGVAQRQQIMQKGNYPEVLHMSATPIPRTMVHLLYGDMDDITIKGKPKNRLPTQTRLVSSHKRESMLQFLLSQLQKEQEQFFWVVPRIDNSSIEKEPKDLLLEGSSTPKLPRTSIAQLFEQLQNFSSNWKISTLHGQLPSDEQEQILTEFRQGGIQGLVTTTIIEVGVDIPSANIMVISDPHYFGLSQLHQLRGRVGRGGKKSWCFLLLNDDIPSETQMRLKEFANTENGFEIAELDLELRGPGNIEHIQQSGYKHLQFTNLIKDKDNVVDIRNKVKEIIEKE